jgi:predicted chitinase
MSVPFLRPGQSDAAVPRMKKALVRELLALGLGPIAQQINVGSTKYGPATERGVRAFQEAKGLEVDGKVGKDTWGALGVRAQVVDGARQGSRKLMSAGGRDFSSKEATIAAIKSECASEGIGLKTQIAYVVATVDHETAHTFKPVREAYWLDDPDAYLKMHHPDYYPYYGRGFVQLTWESNYRKYGQLVGKDLVGTPDLALDPDVALFVLVHGFKTGGFTGHKLADHVNGQKTDFLNARRCINGVDRQHDIADLAQKYLAQL